RGTASRVMGLSENKAIEPAENRKTRDGQPDGWRLIFRWMQHPRRSWHHVEAFASTGCPGIKGPVPPPVPMRIRGYFITIDVHVNRRLNAHMSWWHDGIQDSESRTRARGSGLDLRPCPPALAPHPLSPLQ